MTTQTYESFLPLPCKSKTKYGTILVSGGGIAGLASALFISGTGYQIEIFEQATELNPIGAGIQLSPNAISVLVALGLDNQIKKMAIIPTAIEIYDASHGKKIVDIPLGDKMAEKYRQPYMVIHRADLQEILFRACQRNKNIKLHMGTRVLKAKPQPDGISIIVDKENNVNNHHGLALVAADGVYSVIRNEHFSCSKERFTGTHVLRALVKSENIPNVLKNESIKMWLAPNAHAVFYPVCEKRYYNILLTVDEKFVKNNKNNKITGGYITQKLISSKWSSHFLQLLDNDSEWNVWPLFETPKLQRWQKENILLVGDAAHAMQPYAAQGAAMGLEDAATLGWALSQNWPLTQAFERYQHDRIKRVNTVRRLSRQNRILYHLPSGLASIRNIGMRAMGGSRILNRQNRVYRWSA